MRTRSKVAVVVATLVCAALGWIGSKQLPAYRAYRRLEDLGWMKAASPDELRQTAQLALGSWLADPHDAFLVLKRHGDKSSVPFLRAALTRRPAGNVAACTWSHGQEALDRILDENSGEK
jgi:hypothetical protein